MAGRTDAEESLREFASHPVGWRAIQERFALAQAQMLSKAARETGEKHLIALGQLEGFETAISLIRLLRNEMKGKSE